VGKSAVLTDSPDGPVDFAADRDSDRSADGGSANDRRDEAAHGQIPPPTKALVPLIVRGSGR